MADGTWAMSAQGPLQKRGKFRLIHSDEQCEPKHLKLIQEQVDVADSLVRERGHIIVALKNRDTDQLEYKAGRHPDREEADIADNLEGIVAEILLDKAWHALGEIQTFPKKAWHEKDLPVASQFCELCKVTAVFDTTGQRRLKADFRSFENAKPSYKGESYGDYLELDPQTF